MSFDTTWLAGWLEGTGLWLLTYSAHSTILLGAAWLLHRRLPRYSETLWKTALLGGLLTSSMQMALGLPSMGGTITLATHAAGRPIEPVEQSASMTLVSPPPAVRSASLGEPRTAREPSPQSVELSSIGTGTEPRTASASPSDRGFPSQWGQLAVVVWLAGALALTTLLAVRYLRFRVRVRGRRQVTTGGLARRFDRLRDRSSSSSRIRITTTNGISVPFAKGGFRPEICLPERVLTELDEEKQDAILAHELAHHEHNDPAWHLLNELTATLLFFQPLNRKACRELREQAELRCDRRAVALTGSPVALARCLTEIAGWTLPRPPLPIAAAVSPDGSSLGRRVSRLLSNTGGPDRGTTKWAVLVSATLLLAALGLAPGFS